MGVRDMLVFCVIALTLAAVLGAAVSIPNLTLRGQLVELVDTGNLYAGAVLHLYKTSIALGPTTAVGDFVEADFSGYAASSTIVWGTPFYQPNGVPVVNGDMKTFVVDDPATILNTVYGWYCTNAAGTVYLFGRPFDAPVILTAPGQGLNVVPTIPAYNAL
jgi:hypothetical protein